MDSAVRPRRRTRIRILPIVGYVIVVLGIAWFFDLQATTTFIFVRHADVDPNIPLAEDPPLTPRGQRRAEMLADFLADIDVVSSVDAIYATTTKRTQQTAAPLASRLGQQLNIDDPYQVERLIHRLFRDRKGKITLIVTDADAIAPLIAELHGKNPLPEFGPNDYDDLYIVTYPFYGKVKTLRFHYGEPPEDLGPENAGATPTFSATPAP